MPNSNWSTFEHLMSIDTDDCILWPHGLTNGYAEARHSGKRLYLHAVSCEMEHGPRPVVEGTRIETAHSCGVRRCINRKHLRWATAAENNADKLGHSTTNRGENSARAKLTEDEVRMIRRRRQEGVLLRVLAADYGVATTTISGIVNGHKWAWMNE